MAGHNNRPIIKRKKVIVAGGHHGGAWKVAYADFVTAMMAFFLLMWLLNATTEQQRKGIADYFAPMIPLSRVSGGSDGMFGGDSMSSVEMQQADGQVMQSGDAGESEYPQNDAVEREAARAAEIAALRRLEEDLLGRGGESSVSEQALRHVVTRLTDEGLIIEIFALPGEPIFADRTTDPLPVMKAIVAMIARLSAVVTNPVAVAGHVASRPVVLANYPVWDLSVGRADAVRLLLQDGGLDSARMQRVTGQADRQPAVPEATSERNDRIEIIFLRTAL
jgi:chemotaxis protein MotB